jgi:hypothetical protein
MPKPLLIMVAGPYRSGAQTARDRVENLRALNRAALAVLRKGHHPVVGVNAALPIIDVAGADRYDDIMMPVCRALAERCDAVLRIGGASGGADEETAAVRRNGGAVFRSLDEIPDVRENA